MRHLLPLAILLAGCATGATPGGPAAGPAPRATAPALEPPRPALPPIPLVLGKLQPNVVYPSENQLIESRDSNFIFGSVGNGHAALTINGTPVKVLPNGSFIAFLPNPPVTAPQYQLVAVLGADTARFVRTVRLLPPQPQLTLDGPLVVDSASITPDGRYALRDDELVRVSVRAPANATVLWRGMPNATHPLVSDAALPGPRADGTPDSARVPARFAGAGERWATTVPAREMRQRSEILVARGADTVHLALPAILPAPPDGTWGMLGADSSVVGDTDRVIIGRPEPSGTYKWLLMAGTVVPVTGYAGDFVRVRLDDALEIWVNESDLRLLPPGYSPPRRIAGNATLTPAPGWVDLEIPMASRPPFLVQERDHQLVLTLYGVTANTDIIHYTSNDSLVRVVHWTQDVPGRAVYTLRLATQPFGYLAFWRDGNFVLRVRRPPTVNPARPLAGLVITVDPGHPPIGATGPTGLYEGDAVLAVGLKVRDMLQQRGAKVIMTRTAPGPVALGDRPIIARRADADALVSIHLNALPDGVNPFPAAGTGAYFFHAQSEPLARALQRGMVSEMGLRNLGVNYDNLALARPTWMPAVLCEGAFIMMPDQEAALRTPQFQSAYARGIVDGLEQYFRSLAAR